MATSGLYGATSATTVTYFEWFVFQQSATAPATPTGGSWNFVTNTGTPPAGWSNSIPSSLTDPIYASIAFVDSRFPNTIVWSTPGLIGSQGPTGPASTVAVGTTTTGAAGSSASVVNSGTSSAAVFDFTIPRGDKGDTGAGVAAGGTTGQVLAKASNTDYDTSWINLVGGLAYQGNWNASTNTPTLTSSTGTNGFYYTVSVAGSTNLNGITDWQVGDWAIFNGTIWQKIDQTNQVTSVNGQTGGVILTAADVGALSGVTSADGSITVSQIGTVVDLAVSAASPASTLLLQVRNNSGATMTKGTVVYINGAIGQLPTIAKALATSDATSAQTQGLVTADIANNSNGYVTIVGLVTNLDTSAYTDGDQLYLSGTTAGTMTATKQYAPIHLVYVGVVVYAHPTQGKIQVKVQNGYELDELHNVSAQTPTTGQTIVYNSATGLWEKNTVSLTAGVNGTLPIANGGTNATTAAGALTSLGAYPASNPSGYTSNTGTVTSVSGTGTVNGITLTGTVTASGSLTLGGTLGGISNSQLTNSAITINGSAVSLGGSATIAPQAAISNDTTTATAVYPLFAAATTGTPTTIYTSNSSYLYTPSTGELKAKEIVATNGLLVNADSVSSNYTVAAGSNALSIGPLTVNSGVTLTIASGQKHVVI